jgi:class 3 adenylate cyclase
MTRKTATLSILFADICGSTSLYETLGDAIARGLVSQCLALMTQHVEKQAGSVVKTLGDEIMCTFSKADQAVAAAMDMQEGVTDDLPRINPDMPSTMTIRVGLHHGLALLEAGDVFGDAVNIAARMAGLAKGGQILTTRETARALTPTLRASTRHLDRVAVKGKAEEIDVFEVTWHGDDVTRMATGLLKTQPKSARLVLRYHTEELRLDQDMDTVILGRHQKADLVVNDSMASREHARLECRRGRFILTDQSTNGTYIVTPNGPCYLRRESIVLTGTGTIALGRELSSATEVVVYSCE